MILFGLNSSLLNLLAFAIDRINHLESPSQSDAPSMHQASDQSVSTEVGTEPTDSPFGHRKDFVVDNIHVLVRNHTPAAIAFTAKFKSLHLAGLAVEYAR